MCFQNVVQINFEGTVLLNTLSDTKKQNAFSYFQYSNL